MMLSHRTDVLELDASIERLVVLGDPHGDVAALRAVLARARGPGAAIVSAGDNIGYADGPTSSALCAMLAEHRIASIYGNHEEWLRAGGTLAICDGGNPQLTPEALAFVRALPRRIDVRAAAAPDLSIRVVHSLTDGLRWEYVDAHNAADLGFCEEVDVTFIGHSHGPRIYTLGDRCEEVRALDLDAPLDHASVSIGRGRRYAVDAGSLARPGYHPAPAVHARATYAALDLRARTLSLVSLTP
jgi:predicted phosphodiesterase